MNDRLSIFSRMVITVIHNCTEHEVEVSGKPLTGCVHLRLTKCYVVTSGTLYE